MTQLTILIEIQSLIYSLLKHTGCHWWSLCLARQKNSSTPWRSPAAQCWCIIWATRSILSKEVLTISRSFGKRILPYSAHCCAMYIHRSDHRSTRFLPAIKFLLHEPPWWFEDVARGKTLINTPALQGGTAILHSVPVQPVVSFLRILDTDLKEFCWGVLLDASYFT